MVLESSVATANVGRAVGVQLSELSLFCCILAVIHVTLREPFFWMFYYALVC
jgi:hypothetical protein